MRRWKRWLRALRREDGFAVPTATLMLLAATGIVTVGVVTAIQVQGGVVRDQATKSALPQAEAGVNQALLHFNRILPGSNPCGPVSGTAPAADGWCAPVSGGFDGGTFAYQVRPTAAGLDIVSTGNYGDTTRRVHVQAVSSSGQSIFADATVLSQDGISLDSNAEIIAGVGTNGSVSLSSNSKVCGPVSVGLGQTVNKAGNSGHFNDPSCTIAGTPTTQPLTLPPVNQGDAATVNDNGRFFALDRISGQTTRVCFNGKRGNGSNGSCGQRHLDIANNASVTLGGSKYSFCRLTMSSNSSLYIQSGKTVVIYFDSPEACGLPSGTTQLNLSSNSRITSTSGGPANVAMLFVGSPTSQTKINLSSNTSIDGSCEQNFVIYAPRTDISFNSNSTYCGAIAGRSIDLDSNTKLYADSASDSFILPNTAAHYVVSRFVECTSSAGSVPTTGC